MTNLVQENTGAEAILWDLSDFYASSDDPAIARDLATVQREAETFAQRYRGRIASLSASDLAAALVEAEQIYDRIGRLGSFASLQWSTDTLNATYGALFQRIREAGSQLQQTLLFFELEWAAASDEQAQTADDPGLARWRYYLLTARKRRPYQLSEPEEKILEEKSVTGNHAWSRFYGETFAAARYDLDGQQLSQDAVLRRLFSPEREQRRRAADSLTVGLRETVRTATFVHNTLMADKASTDQLRHFPTWISARNLDNQTTDEAVNALVTAVTSRYDIVQRYYTLKREILGYDELYEYDRYAVLSTTESHYSWEEARQIVLTAFKTFDPRMASIADEFFEKRWIHAAVLPGKRGGAFASPTVPSAHPYLFLNYTGIGTDIQTLAHELGHGIHAYLARKQSIFEAESPLTTAETASTFGEMLVFNDLMNRETNPAVRISMLASKIEDAFGTVFRQVSMNRFEDAIHTARRTTGELSTDRFNELWLETQRPLYGSSVTLRDDYKLWWSYIPHFITTPGYVYAYAFGELLVMSLFNEYRRQGAAFVPAYLDALAAGGSDTPDNIMAKVGINLNDPSFWHQGLTVIDEMVTQLGSLVQSAK